jgi:hypothetical protein
MRRQYAGSYDVDGRKGDEAMEMPSAPRCYILDESYRLVLACPPSPDDPLNHLYGVDSRPDALPTDVESTVRGLTMRWERIDEALEASALVGDVRVTVAPLHGEVGRHIAVFIERDAA